MDRGIENEGDECVYVWCNAKFSIDKIELDFAMCLHGVTAPSGSFIKLLGWKFFVPVLLGCIVQLFFALLVNNLATFRAYPVFW